MTVTITDADGAEYRVEQCRSCGMPIYWTKTRNGKSAPWDVLNGKASGISHFATCAQAGDWRKRT